MTEAALQYAWENLRFRPIGLKTTLGKEIILLNVGKINRTQGPDFLNASVRIDGITYNGAVELHLTTPLWFEHGHHQDKNYDKVILHVVYQTDLQPVFRSNGTIIPELELSGYLEARFVQLYEQLSQTGNRIPCKGMTQKMPESDVHSWLQQLGTERLKGKSVQFQELFTQNKNDWTETVWQAIAGWFGGNINKEAFIAVARHIPYKILLRNREELSNIEALLFGSAGFLEADFYENYPQELRHRWQHLKIKYQLEPLKEFTFAFGGLRPVNFPTVRLAQLAKLIQGANDWFYYLEEPDQLKTILENISLSEYWDEHYRFDVTSNKKIKKSLGKDFILQWMINCWIPLAMMYFRHQNETQKAEDMIRYLQKLQPEKNHITEEYRFLLSKPKNALETQGLIRLQRDFCTPFRCFDCRIGRQILKLV